MVYAAGGCSTWDDAESMNAFGGENWEMDTQLNVNFVFGLEKGDTHFGKLAEEEAEEVQNVASGSIYSMRSTSTAIEAAA